MPTNRNVWMLMSFGHDASWEGNIGYQDDVTTQYQFNNFVPNSRRVGLGHILIIRDRDNVLGFARIERLEMELGSTSFRRCPTCGTTKFNRRVTKQPVFRCRNSHTFAEPTTETTPCTWYTIHYGNSFLAVMPPTSAHLFDDGYTNDGTQQSIRPIEFEKSRSKSP